MQFRNVWRAVLMLSSSLLAHGVWASGAPFNNPFTGQPHKFVAGNYTDLGVDANGNMPHDKTALQANASADLDRLKAKGIDHVRVWASLGYNDNDYQMKANRISWLAEIAAARQMALTVDLIDASGNNYDFNWILGQEAHINNLINTVIAQNANKNHLYWSLGNEIGGATNPLGFATFYENKVALMRQKGARKISFQPVPGSLHHYWNGDTRTAAIRVINASDDVSVHFYAHATPQNEHTTSNALEFSSTQQWITLAHERCKPAIIGEFGIVPLDQRTDANVAAWLNYFRETAKVDQVSFWQFMKNDVGHVDPLCFCDLPGVPNVGNGPHLAGMNGYIGLPPTYPGTSNCPPPPPPPPGSLNFLTGENNPVYFLASHGQYLSSENGTTFVNANRPAVGEWEKFVVLPNSDGTYSIRANNTRYLDVDRLQDHRLVANNTDRNCTDCKYRITLISGDIYSVQLAATNLYMSGENALTNVRVNRSAVGAWEKWTIKNVSTPPPATWKTITSLGELVVGQKHYSNNGAYYLTMQTDGNFVLYHQNNTPRWHTHTYNNAGSRCYMQSDGNLVIYHPNGTPLWNSQTHNNPGAALQISDNGFIRVVKNDTTLWQSN